MASYKVSYKVLRQQGEEIKAAAKLVDGYAEQITQVSARLGDDTLLAEVRQNLSKLRTQLGESRAVLNTAGELLIKTVGSYTDTETRQVKKVDGYRAHNRDFYKRPIAVASVGGAATGASAAAAASAAPQSTSTTTVHYTDNSVNLTTAAPAPAAGVGPATNAAAVGAAPAPEPGAVAAGVAAGVGVLGGAGAAAGAVVGIRAKKRHDAEQEAAAAAAHDASATEAALEEAVQRLHDLEQE